MANSKRQNAVCNKLSVLTYAEMMQVALWMATVGDETPSKDEVHDMATRLQNLAENFEAP